MSTYPPDARVDNYVDELLDLLSQVVAVAKAVRAQAVLWPGDLFHSKTRTSMEAAFHMLMVGIELKEAGILNLAIPGNHDLYRNRYESLDTQPLGHLFKTGVFTNVSSTRGCLPVTLYENNFRVTVEGIPWPDAQKAESWISRVGTRDPNHQRVVMAHCFANQTADDYFGDPVWPYDGLSGTQHDLYVFGHDHRDLGMTALDSGQAFVNFGAICRVAQNEYDMTRELAFALVEMQPGQPPYVQRVRLNYRAATELFDPVKKAQRQQERAMVESFVEALHTADVDVADVPTLIGTLGLAADVKDRVLTYIVEAE